MAMTLTERAAKAGRDYITPEDVQRAINDGADKMDLWGELLAILGKQRYMGAEDYSLCCFLAHRFEADR